MSDSPGYWIDFLNPREGWVLTYLQATPGLAILFHTTDSGAHWSRTARFDVNKVFRAGSIDGGLIFRDSSTGWLSAGPRYMTQDGGATWQVQTIPPPPGVRLDSSHGLNVSSPFFFNAREGLLSATPPTKAEEATYVYGSSDGGRHWSFQADVPAPKVFPGFGPSSFIDPSNWVLFDGTRLIRTADSGKHWSAVPSGLPSGYPMQLKFDDLSNGWLVLYRSPTGSELYRTTDGGSHWTPVSLPSAS